MDYTKEQLSEVLCKHAERENGLQDLMEIMIESMMVAEIDDIQNTEYICTSKESERPAPDTLDETQPRKVRRYI